MSRLCRLKSASHGEDGKWAYEEIVRLRACLQKANDQMERFEREWYLSGDEIDRLREKLDYANAVIEQRNGEITSLRAALQHEADVAESYKAEADEVRAKLELAEACLAGDGALITGLKEENEALRNDAERYKTLANYLVSTDTSRDDEIVACNTAAELSAVLDSMKGQ